ncbi:MAG: hypothetical protein KA116_02740 [Proteobacteria bacterium]|nr:hypothetical protein [Pseudomonadota bacterium]
MGELILKKFLMKNYPLKGPRKVARLNQKRSALTDAYLKFSVSHKAYRHIASIIKPPLVLFVLNSLISYGYADFTLQKTGGLFRLKGKIEESPEISVEKDQLHGALCGDRRTQDLIIKFKKIPSDWSKDNDVLESLKGVNGAPCSIVGNLGANNSFELRVSYLQEKPMQFLPIEFGGLIIVDHWFSLPKVKKEKALISSNKITVKQNSEKDDFKDEMSWKQILGASGSSIDINSPELNKYRAKDKEKDFGLSDELIERKSLEIPVMDYPVFVFPIKLYQKEFKPKLYTKTGGRENKTLAEAMNYLKILIERKDWLRAQQAFIITKKSKVGHLLRDDDPYLVALEGFLAIKVGEELKNEEQISYGLNTWSKGLRKVMRKGVEDEDYLLYSFEEYIRKSSERGSFVQLAEFLVWAEKFSWAPEISERLDYLKGEVYFSMKVFNEANEIFQNFISTREGSSGKKIYDKEYISASLFRQGDIYSSQRKWKEAVVSYSDALQKLPGTGKFLFEGSWYPKEITKYPEVLLNRAQAYYFMGMESSALRDYRAFVFTNGNHKYVSLAMFKIAELLERVGAEKSKIIGTLSECSFKRENTIGARLCEAKKAAIELSETPEKRIPNKINAVERIFTSNSKLEGSEFFSKENLTVYGKLLWGKPLMDKGISLKVMEALEASNKVESSEYLSAWNFEYYVTALHGYLKSLNENSKYKEVIETYERKQRNSLWKSTRPELLWQLSKAFADQGLWDEAMSSWKQSEKLRERINRKSERPFDVDNDSWFELGVKIGSRLYAEKKLPINEVLKNLSKLNNESEKFLRLSIPLYLAQENYNKANEAWKKIHEKYSLSWDDLLSWEKVLEKLNKTKERTNILESTAGVWIAGDKMSDKPPVDVLLALANSRENNSQNDKALLVYDYLLNLNGKQSFSRAMISYQKAKLLRKMGNNALAIKSFKEAIESDPESLWAKLSKSENNF